MPVDTRSKRASSVQVLMPFVLAPVLPDGTIAAADRQHIVWMYSGILARVALVPARRIHSVEQETRTLAIEQETRVLAAIDTRTEAID